jgi:hypothetical protein
MKIDAFVSLAEKRSIFFCSDEGGISIGFGVGYKVDWNRSGALPVNQAMTSSDRVIMH